MKKLLILPFLLIPLVLAGCTHTPDQPSEPPVGDNEQPNEQPANGGQPDGDGDEVPQQADIKLFEPEAGATIASPLTVTGEARGTWYFEADFPVILTDEDGNTIAQGIAQAQGDWMTEDFVPYEAELTFETEAAAGELILQKANPSGLPENADEVHVPVNFE